MKYRLLGGFVGLALGVGLFYGLETLVPARYAVGVAVGAGAGGFLVVDGSAGVGEGWIYHRVRSRVGKLRDAGVSVLAGVLAGLIVAWLSVTVGLGEVGGAFLAGTGALLGANFAYLFRRPSYEQQLEDME